MKKGGPYKKGTHRTAAYMKSPMKFTGGYYGPSVEDEEGFIHEGEQISKTEFDAMKAKNEELLAEAKRLEEIGGTANSAKAKELYSKIYANDPRASGLQGLQEEGINVSSLDDIRAMMEELAPGGVMPKHWQSGQQAAKDPNYALYRQLSKVLNYEQSAKGKEESARQARLDEMGMQK